MNKESKHGVAMNKPLTGKKINLSVLWRLYTSRLAVFLGITSVALAIFGASPALAANPTLGLTIITHGYQASLGGAYLPNWVSEMANAIKARTGANIPIYRVWYDKQSSGTTADDQIRLCDTPTGPSCQYSNVPSIDITSTGGAIILLDWAAVSNDTAEYPAQNVADRFFNYFFYRDITDTTWPSYPFISLVTAEELLSIPV